MTIPSTERLLAEVGWLRRLAVSIVRDAHDADDAVQDAWLNALRARGHDVRDRRAWLSTILRRSFATQRREADRRAMRERAAARPEASASVDDVVQRMQQQRSLLEIVESLDEPYRTTILLRFFEDLPPRRIAARTHTPVATVRTRLKRGLEQLREKLERRHGSRDAWLGALAPVATAHVATGSSSTLLPILAMKTSTKVLLLAVGLAASLAGWLMWNDAPSTSALSMTKPADVRATEVDETSPTHVDPITERSPRLDATVATSAPISSPAAASSATRRVHGRVLDAEGRPLGGLRVGQFGSKAADAVRADDAGRFELAIAGTAALVVVEPEWITVLFGSANGGEAADRILVAARRVALDGTVVDSSRRAVASAVIDLQLPSGFRARFPGLLDYSGTEQWGTTSDAEGHFALANCPNVAGLTLFARHPRHAAGSLELPRDATGERVAGLVIEMGDLASREDDVVGAVVDERGAPIAGASVAAGGASCSSDARGEFRLERALVGDAQRVQAVKYGYLPASVATPPTGEYVLVPMSGPAATISGRVIDGDGHGVANAKVWVADPTFFGLAPDLHMDVTAEGLAASQLTREDVERHWHAAESLDDATARATLPALPFWSFARSDSEGRFRVEGLARRDYTLRAMDVTTLQIAEVGPVAADRSDVVLVLPANGVWPRLAGQIVDPDGVPVVGARIEVATTVLAVPAGQFTTYRGESRGEEAVSDEHGRFELRSIPRNAALCVAGDHIERLEYGSVRSGGLERLVGADPEHVRIVVQYRYHLRVDASAAPESIDEAIVLDARGEPLTLDRIEGHSYYDARAIPVRDGLSESWNVSAEARTIVLRKAGVEVKRTPVDLVPRELNVIRP